MMTPSAMICTNSNDPERSAHEECSKEALEKERGPRSSASSVAYPEVLQQYEVQVTIASALFGTIRRGHHRLTGEYVAIKEMELLYAARRRAKETNRAVEEDVFMELKVNLKIKSLGGHPNVVAMKDCYVTQVCIGVIMEYCGRGELLDVLNRRGNQLLPISRILRFFRQIAAGVTFLHRHGIAHRDLSLENVLVDENDCCKISDFGLAYMSSPVHANATGKIHYMAPEACRNDAGGWYNPMKADVWSLGVILFAMVTGKYPYNEPVRHDREFRLLEDFGVEYLLEKMGMRATLADPVVDLLRLLLITDPERRPPLTSVSIQRCLELVQDEEHAAIANDVIEVTENHDGDEENDQKPHGIEDDFQSDGDLRQTKSLPSDLLSPFSKTLNRSEATESTLSVSSASSCSITADPEADQQQPRRRDSKSSWRDLLKTILWKRKAVL